MAAPKRKKTEGERRREAFAHWERKAGRPLRVYAGPAMAHRDALRAAGMTDRAIAAQATVNGFPMHQTTVSILGTKAGHCHRSTAEGIMSVTEPTPCPRKLVDARPAIRYLQGLVCAGYSENWLSNHVVYEYTNRRKTTLTYVSNLMNGRHPQIEYRTFERIALNCSKLEYVDPVDAGVPKQAVSRSKNRARERGWAPLSCWDEDSIRDLDAFPEWTGRCGTPQGYRIHLREKIPPCKPCLMGHYIYNKYPHLAELMGIVTLGLGSGSHMRGTAAR